MAQERMVDYCLAMAQVSESLGNEDDMDMWIRRTYRAEKEERLYRRELSTNDSFVCWDIIFSQI